MEVTKPGKSDPTSMIISLDSGEGSGPQTLIGKKSSVTSPTITPRQIEQFSNRKSRSSSLIVDSPTMRSKDLNLSPTPRRNSASNNSDSNVPTLNTIMRFANSDLAMVPEVTSTPNSALLSPGDHDDDEPGSNSLSVPGSAAHTSVSSTRRGSDSSVHSLTVSANGQNVAVIIDANNGASSDDPSSPDKPFEATLSVSISRADGREFTVSGALTVTPGPRPPSVSSENSDKPVAVDKPTSSLPSPVSPVSAKPVLPRSPSSTIQSISRPPSLAITATPAAHPFGVNPNHSDDSDDDEVETLITAKRRFSVQRPPSPPRRSSITKLPAGLLPPSPPPRRASISHIPEFRQGSSLTNLLQSPKTSPTFQSEPNMHHDTDSDSDHSSANEASPPRTRSPTMKRRDPRDFTASAPVGTVQVIGTSTLRQHDSAENSMSREDSSNDILAKLALLDEQAAKPPRPNLIRIKSKEAGSMPGFRRQASMPNAAPMSRADFLNSVQQETHTKLKAQGVSFSGLKRQSTLLGTSVGPSGAVGEPRPRPVPGGPLKSILKKSTPAATKDTPTVKEGVALPLIRRQTTRRMQFADEIGRPLEERRMYLKVGKSSWWQMIFCCFAPAASLAGDQWSENTPTPSPNEAWPVGGSNNSAENSASAEFSSDGMNGVMPDAR